MKEDDERLIKDFFSIWGEASVRGDRATLERIIADDYLFVNPKGVRLSKSQMIEGTLGGEPVFSTYKVSDDILQSFGNSAVRTGKLTAEGLHKGRNGKYSKIGGEFRYTNLFVKTDVGWQIVLTQVTEITVPPETQQSTAA
jgi:ketosteroid isomerase-like protein